MDMIEQFLEEQTPRYDNFFKSLMAGDTPQRTDTTPAPAEQRTPIGYGAEMGPPGSGDGQPRYADQQQSLMSAALDPKVQEQARQALGSEKYAQLEQQGAQQAQQQQQQQMGARPTGRKNWYDSLIYSPASVKAYDANIAGQQKAWDTRQTNQQFNAAVNPNSPYAAFTGMAGKQGDLARAGYLDSLGDNKDERTNNIKEYEYARQNGFTGPYTEFIRGNKRSGASRVSTNVNTKLRDIESQVALDDRLATAKNSREYVGSVVQAGRDARQSMAKTDRMLNMLESGTKTGFGQNWITTAKQALRTAGVKTDTSDAEEIQVLMGDLVMKRVDETSGAVSEKEMDLFKEYSANYGKSPEGNIAILGFYKQKIQRDKEIANQVRGWQKQKLSSNDIEDNIYRYMDENPLVLRAQKNPAAAPAPAPLGNPGGKLSFEDWKKAGKPGR